MPFKNITRQNLIFLYYLQMSKITTCLNITLLNNVHCSYNGNATSISYKILEYVFNLTTAYVFQNYRDDILNCTVLTF